MGSDRTRSSARIEDGLQRRQSRLARADGRVGSERSRTTSPSGPSFGPSSTTSGGAEALRARTTARSWRRATPRRSTRPSSRSTSNAPKITAVRLELLNDPNLPLRRAGPVDLRHVRADRVPGRRPRRSISPSKRTSSKFAKRHGRRESARARAGTRSSTTRAASGASPGRSNTPSTATTKPPGASTSAPAAATCRGRPCSCSRSRSKLPGGVRLTFKLAQNHGGWNSDDNQNNNLGRFRFSVTDGRERRRPIPLPRRRPRRSSRSRADQRTPEQVDARVQLLADDGRRMAGSQRRIEALWQSIRAARRSSCCTSATSRGTTHRLDRGNFLTPAEEVTPGVPAFLHPLDRGRRHADAARLRPLARRSPLADDGPRDRQSHLAGLLRHRPGRPRPRIRHAGRAAVASRAARLAGRRVHGPRLEPQAPAPADRHVGDVSAVERRHAGAAGPRSGQPAAGPRAAVPRRRRSRSATSPWPPAACLNRKIGGPSVYPPAPEFLFQPPASYGPKTWNVRHGRRPLSPGALHVPLPLGAVSGAAERSTPPTASSPASAASRSNTPLQALTTLNEPLFLEVRAALALQDASPKAATSDAERLALRLPPLPVARAASRTNSQCCRTSSTQQQERFGKRRRRSLGAC